MIRVVRVLLVLSALAFGWQMGIRLLGRLDVVIETSMSPTLREGSRIYERSLFPWQELHRGDIITLWDGKTLILKRIVGLPGDTVHLRLGYVYLNGQVLDEPYVPSKALTTASTAGDVLVAGASEYIVMGDNRPASRDSREFGPVKRTLIRGRVTWGFRDPWM